MTKFKKGDIVKRIKPSNFPEEFGEFNEIYKVLDVDEYRGIRVIEGFTLYANPDSFELVNNDLRADNIYFSSEDINECRTWLRDNGLELYGRNGWVDSDEETTKIGAITFRKGDWEAVIIERF